MRKLHLDTDIGGDIDDLCALAMALNCLEGELVAVTTVSDAGGRRAGYARYVLEIAGRRDVPCGRGRHFSRLLSALAARLSCRRKCLLA